MERFKSYLVAVYGSLRHGMHNHRLIEHCELVGIEWIKGDWEMISLGGFPGIIESDGKEILIELYKVTDEITAKRLDRLEGYPDFYNKKIIDTVYGPAEIYFLDKHKYNDYPTVESGDWFNYKK